MKLSELSKEKKLTSIKINNVVLKQFKKLEIPLSIVVEASLIQFLKLSSKQQILFLDDNSLKKTEMKDIKKQKKLKQEINEMISALGIVAYIPLITSIGILSKLIRPKSSLFTDDFNKNTEEDY